jgi:chromosome segregation ATPase
MDWLNDPQLIAVAIVTALVVGSTLIPLSLIVIKTFRSFQETAAYATSLFSHRDDKPSKIETSMSASIQKGQEQFQATIVDTLGKSMDNLISTLSKSDQFKDDVLEGLQRRLTQLETDRTGDRRYIDELRQQAEADRRTISEQTAQLNDLALLKKRVSDLEEKVTMLIGEKLQLAKERDAALAECATLREENARLIASLAAKTEALARAEAELVALRIKVTTSDVPKPAETGA